MGASLEPSLNLAWVLLCGFLVMFMQAGFAMVETGFTRARSAANTMAMNFVIYPVGVLGFWAVGYGLMMGGVGAWPTLGGGGGGHELGLTLGGKAWGLVGAARFALVTVANDPAHLAMFLFAAVFMDTASTIPTGAMAERWRFTAFLVYGLFMSTLLYPLYGNWVWGGGWLSQLGANLRLGHGHVDFAGSSVVHMTGGLTGLAGAIVLGPRLGRFRADRVEPALKPNQPKARTRVPTTARGRLWPGMAPMVPSARNRPRRGPSTMAPASPVSPPVMWTTLEPAKSTWPWPSRRFAPSWESHPPPHTQFP